MAPADQVLDDQDLDDQGLDDQDLDDQAERLFELVLGCPPEHRRAFLEDVCAADPKLRRELAALLPHADADPEFLATPLLQRPVSDLAELFGGGNQQDGDGQEEESDLPKEIGGYRIVRILGYGASAVVYEARQRSPKRAVALKLLWPGPVTPALKRRFTAEAQLLSRFRHPGIVRIFEAGVQELRDPRGTVYRLPFLVMELVSGSCLKSYVSCAELSLEDRLRLFAKICDAVDHAHRQGVLHRDLKPANILVDESGQPKIVDFGIARSSGLNALGSNAEPGTRLTATGQVLGSLAYMSPEQLRDSHRVDARSDVYALGVILYQMLSGQLPYEVHHLSVAETAALIERTEPAPLDTFNRACRGDLQTITAKAMARDRSRRYSSAAQLAKDVRLHIDQLPLTA